MKNLTSYLLVMFMILFWGFRILVAVNASLDSDFAVKLYFGVDLYNILMPIVQGTATLGLDQVTSLFFSAIGMALPLFVLLELLLDKNSKNHPKDKKTDWFYKNEEYDREIDERADKNNYRTL